MEETLKGQIDYLYKIDEEWTLEDVTLNPHKNPIFYKFLKEYHKLPLPEKYCIKVRDSYFPRLFDSFIEAEKTALSMNNSDLFEDVKEQVFIHLTLFEPYSIVEI